MAKIRYHIFPMIKKEHCEERKAEGENVPSRSIPPTLLQSVVYGCRTAVPPLYNWATLHYKLHGEVTVRDAGNVNSRPTADTPATRVGLL